MILQGQSFLIPSGPGDKKHQHFVVVEPRVLPGHGRRSHVLLAGVTTIYEGVHYDSACVLEPGDHPFIKHHSYIDYRNVRIVAVTHVETMRDKGVWIENDSCSRTLIERIFAGIFVSKHVKRFVQDALREEVK